MRALARVLVLVLAAAATAACLADSGGGADPAVIDLPAPDVDHWLMPVDAYIPQSSLTTDYAESVLVSECLAGAGYTWDVPAYDIHAPLPETSNAARRTLFTPEIAATWGYLGAPGTQQNAAAQEEFETRPLPAGSEQQFSQCLDQVRAEQLPVTSGEALNFAAALGMAADQAAGLDTAVIDAAGEWRACMAPLGISDLPQSPEQMPTSTLKVAFGRGSSAADVDVSDTRASAYEIEVATADAACRESSGWTQVRYDAEWSRQVTAVQENADALERIRAENEAAEARAVAVLAARGLG